MTFDVQFDLDDKSLVLHDTSAAAAEAAAERAESAAETVEGVPAMIAPIFSASTTYASGEYVIYSGKLYQFTSAHTGAWTGTDAEETTVTEKLNEGGSGDGLTEDIKQALLQIAQKVAYIDDQGATYYQALEDALYPPAELDSISAVYTQSGTVYDTDTLDSLKPDLVVTAHYSDQTTETVTTYTLSGTLTEGTSTVTVSYGGKTTTFAVTVTHYEQKSDMNGWTDGIPYTDLTIVENEYVDRADGSFDPYDGWSRTGYVPCDGASTLVIPQMSGSGGGSRYNAFYTQNHVFISAFEMVHTAAVTVNVPSNAYYFALSEKASQLAQVISDGIVPHA